MDAAILQIAAKTAGLSAPVALPHWRVEGLLMDQRLLAATGDQARSAASALGLMFADGVDESATVTTPSVEPVMPAAIFITYGAGSPRSQRAVTIHQIWDADETLYVRGLCHMRQALRTFRADRISELICLATGEVAANPVQWLRGHALFDGHGAVSQTSAALRRCRDELALLALVARADGYLDPDETEVAVDLVMMATDDEIDRDQATAYVRRLAPSPIDIEAAIARLARRSERWPPLKRAMRRLIDADGRVTIEEQLAWAAISSSFDAAFEAEGEHSAAASAAAALAAALPG